jgi:Uma2 family endonuclease
MSTVLTAPDQDRADPNSPDFVLPKGFEFVDGQLKELNVSWKSAVVGGELFRRVANHVVEHRLGQTFPQDTPFQCFADDPKRIRKPDAAFIARGRYTAGQYETEGYVSVYPDLAAEVISPNDLAYDVADKRGEWLAVGVKLLWVIEPEDKTIHVYRPDGTVTLLHEKDTLSGEGVLPGFSLPVAELFRTALEATA